MSRGLAPIICLILSISPAQAQRPFITLASTTSTQNSGLFRHVLPKFTRATGIAVRVVAVGTGAAIRLARAGDADVLLVHHKESELAFVAAGHGSLRRSVMYNDFILVGPGSDPAEIRSILDVDHALSRIASAQAIFLSRGDQSGTHKRELELWADASTNPAVASGEWYRETGSGMGATLNVAAAMGGYTLTDRGSWLGFANKRGLVLLHEGDPRLRNEYGVVLVSRDRHPHVKAKAGQVFVDWILSEEGMDAIDEFEIDGTRLFHAIR
ncbi:MAG: sulfate transporter [Rhodospirillaceae bacterium]|nr:sulfate transporter [Rhodospirillaceae bacterium]